MCGSFICHWWSFRFRYGMQIVFNKNKGRISLKLTSLLSFQPDWLWVSVEMIIFAVGNPLKDLN